MFNFLFTKTPLMFLVQSLWRDEAYSYLLAKRGVFEIISLTVRDFSPPLYYLVLHFWINIFGKSEIALRSLSLVFYWAATYVGFLFLNNIFKMNLKKSFFYLLFVAFNPLLLYFAFEVRMYSMFAFFATLSFYALYKKNGPLYLLATILGLYTHYFMVFAVVAQYFAFRYKQKTALLAFAPWMVFAILSKATSSTSFWIEKIPSSKLLTFLGEIYTGYEGGGFFGRPLLFVSIAIMALVAYAWMKNRREHKDHKTLFNILFAWGVVVPFIVLVISFFKPVFLPRYLIFSAVGLVLLMIYTFERMPAVSRLLAIVFFLIITFNYHTLQIAKKTKAPLRKTLTEIKSLMEKDDVLYVTSELDYFTAQYYVGEDKVYIYGKSYAEIPDYIGKVIVSPDKVVSMLPIYPKKAFVLNERGGYEIQALY